MGTSIRTLGRVLRIATRRRGSAGYSLVETVFVTGFMGVVTAMAIPMSGNTLRNFRLTGDVRSLTNTVSLAKMRAASNFDKARVYVDLNARTFHVDACQKSGTPEWVTDGGTIPLSIGVSLGYGSLSAAPPDTQITLAQAQPCRTTCRTAGAEIGNTACVVFNSRGIPVDSNNAPTSLSALYLTDGTAVYGVTVAATGLIQLWTSNASTASWTKQ